MKPWPSIFLLLLLVSCQRSYEYDDSRLEFASDYGSKEFHEVAVRNDSAILATFRYYDSILPGKDFLSTHSDMVFQKAKAYFCKANVEEAKPSEHVDAFSDYLDALWVMDGLTGKRRFFSVSSVNPEYEHFTALIYVRLAWLLYIYDSWDLALECLELSSDCFGKEGNPRGIADNFELMGDVFLAQGDKTGALVYYKKSDSIRERIQTENIYQNFSSFYHRSLDLYNANAKKASNDLLLHALEMTNDDWLRRQVRFMLGYYYFENRQYDSALYNYERSYPLLPRQTIKSYCRIIKAANELGDSIKAAQYGGMLSDFMLERVTQSGNRTRMVMMYENLKTEKVKARQKSIVCFIMVAMAIMVLIVVADSVLIEKRRRRHRNEMETQEKVKALLEEEIASAKKDSRHKEEKIRSLEIELKKALSNPDFQKLPFDKKLETLYAMPISKRVCLVKEANVKAGAAYPELVLSENQMTTLVNAVDAVFPKFSVRILEQYPRLKRIDVMYCCMYVLGITEVQAAALTGKTYQAVWTRSLKLHEIFANDSNLQLVLHDFLKSW